MTGVEEGWCGRTCVLHCVRDAKRIVLERELLAETERPAKSDHPQTGVCIGCGEQFPRQLPKIAVVRRCTTLCLWTRRTNRRETLFNPGARPILKACVQSGLGILPLASRLGQKFHARVQALERRYAATLVRQNFNGQFRILQKTDSSVDHANSSKSLTFKEIGVIILPLFRLRHRAFSQVTLLIRD